MKKKSEIKDWIIFGGIISGIVAGLAYLLVSFGLFALFGFNAMAFGLLLIPIMVLAIIVGAVKWGILGAIYNWWLHKHLEEQSVYWQLSGLLLFSTLLSDFIFKVQINLITTIISVLVSVWIVLLIAKTFKIKIPVRGKK